MTSIITEPTWAIKFGAIVKVLPDRVTYAGKALVPLATAEIVTVWQDGLFVVGNTYEIVLPSITF